MNHHASPQGLDPVSAHATPAFRYKPNYVAAWLAPASEALLHVLGVRRRVHLTTFFDGYGQLSSVKPYPWSGAKEARVAAVVEWQVGDHRHVIAEMADCAWSQDINDHYLAQGVRQDLPHRAHITLDKRVEVGAALQFQALVGQVLRFDRHGGEVDDRPPLMVQGDLILRDWRAERIDKDRIRVTTPPMGSGIRENHMANRNGLDGDGFYLLANALLAASSVRTAEPADQLVERVALALLGGEDKPLGENHSCVHSKAVDDVRRLVRTALDSAGVTARPSIP